MRQQKQSSNLHHPTPIDPTIRKYLPEPVRDRIWFPMPAAESDRYSVIYFGEAIFGFSARMLPRHIYAVQKTDENDIMECISHLKDCTRSQWAKWSAKIGSFHTIGGYIIPVSILDETWRLTKIDQEHLLELAVRLSVQISQVGNANIEFGSDSPFYALKTRVGRCFDKASLLAGIFRLNGIPTRIVGRHDLFDDGEDRGHWLVEAYVGNKWQKYDSAYVLRVIEWIYSEAKRMGLPVTDNPPHFLANEFPYFLAAGLTKLVADGVAVSQISSQDCLHKIDGMYVAAEMDLPSTLRSDW